MFPKDRQKVLWHRTLSTKLLCHSQLISLCPHAYLGIFYIFPMSTFPHQNLRAPLRSRHHTLQTHTHTRYQCTHTPNPHIFLGNDKSYSGCERGNLDNGNQTSLPKCHADPETVTTNRTQLKNFPETDIKRRAPIKMSIKLDIFHAISSRNCEILRNLGGAMQIGVSGRSDYVE